MIQLVRSALSRPLLLLRGPLGGSLTKVFRKSSQKDKGRHTGNQTFHVALPHDVVHNLSLLVGDPNLATFSDFPTDLFHSALQRPGKINENDRLLSHPLLLWITINITTLLAAVVRHDG